MMNFAFRNVISNSKSLNQIRLKVKCNTLTTTASCLLSINKYTERTHNCGQLNKSDIGKNVQLYGWIQYTRFDNKIIALRDSYGITQCIIDHNKVKGLLKKTNLYNETVVKISGMVRARPEGQENSKLSTGDVEIAAESIEILSNAKKDLPILTREDPVTTWNNRLKFRYLDLRSQNMQHALRFRSLVNRILREKLYELNFVECETPTLYNRTPGGANEFIVPTQLQDKFYSLVQSPQQLKQLLMIGGLDRYFQICRCYRDEQGRSDRQPEFTQLDIELSFTNQKLVIELIDDLMYDLMSKISDDIDIFKLLTSSFTKEGRIRSLTFQEAFNMYGTDKPDTRFDWLIESEDCFLRLQVPYTLDEGRLQEIVKESRTNSRIELEVKTEISDSGVTISSENFDKGRKLLGYLRTSLAKEFENTGKKVYNHRFSFVWVVDFPLFTLNDEGKLEPNHHPFTAPTQDSMNFLHDNPLQLIGQHYDLVLNGQEVAGGSIRIHDASLQRQIFTDILGLDESTFGYFIEALKSGCPPHGGIAFGLDRLVAILMNKESIRDVIAFPKSSSGRDPLTECPQELGADVRRLYHIK